MKGVRNTNPTKASPISTGSKPAAKSKKPAAPPHVRTADLVATAAADPGVVDEAQAAGDVLGAHGVLMDAYETDVRGILADRRENLGLPRDPLRAFAESGYAATVAEERVGGTQASWGA